MATRGLRAMAVSDVRFADGFDGADSVAFGLVPSQLLAVVASLLIAYALLSAPWPLMVSAPPAVVVLAAGAAAGWLRLAGRPAVEWAGLAARHLLRPRTGTITGVGAAGTTPPRQPRPPARLRSQGVTARRIAFFSLNGGSGRTTLATEVACRLAAHGHDRPGGAPLRVILIDADPINADVATRLGIPQPAALDFAGAGERVLATHGCGLRALPGSPRPLPPRAQVVESGRLAACLRRVEAEGADVVVIDVGNDLGPLASWALEEAHDIYVVLTPTARGIHDAYRSTALLRRAGLRDRLSYVLNRADGRREVAEVIGDLGGDLVAVIPDEPLLVSAENCHRPLALSGAGPFSAALARLAAHVCAPPRRRSGLRPP